MKPTHRWGAQGGTNIDERCLEQDRVGELESNDSNSTMRSQDETKLTKARSSRQEEIDKHQPEHVHETYLEMHARFPVS